MIFIDRASSASYKTRYYVKATLVFWIATTHVKLKFLYMTFSRILLLRNFGTF